MDLLKLLALDEEDLKIVSAHVQDAVMKVGDLEFIAATKQFVVPMNRFAWEKDATARKPQPERRNSVLHFDRVLSAKLSGIARDKPDDVLSLLADHLCSRPTRRPARSSSSSPAAARSGSRSSASRRGSPISAAPGKRPRAPPTRPDRQADRWPSRFASPMPISRRASPRSCRPSAKPRPMSTRRCARSSPACAPKATRR